MNLDRLNKINARSIHNAGPRYTPGIDSAAPNLEIRALEFALEGLMCSGKIFQKKTVESRTMISRRLTTTCRRSLTIPYSKHVRPPSKLLKCLASLSQSLPRRRPGNYPERQIGYTPIWILGSKPLEQTI